MEEHTKEEINDESNKGEQDDSWKQKSKSRIHQGEIIEGKREKKTVQRLDMQVAKPKEKPKIESIGQGDKLGDIARVNHAIGRLKAPMLKPLHKILYDRPGAVSSLRKNLRLFNGFPFEVDSDLYTKKREKMARFPKVQLKTICQILDLERSGNQAVLVDKIMHFLVNPRNSGKPVKKKRKKKSAKDAKREKKTSSKSKKQQLESGKSKAIVTDSSSDEVDDDDEEEEDEVENKTKDIQKSSVSDNRKDEDDESDSEEEVVKNKDSDESPEDSEDEEIAKPTGKKKSFPKKAAKMVEDASDESGSGDNDSEEDAALKKTKKKPAAQKKVPAKPVPKTKKADSSSNRKRNTASKTKVISESSDDDDDEPLIKMVKKPPTDDQLKGAVNDLLKSANLEEVTMKQICQQVYGLYPGFDLTSRKEFIKETVKSLIS